MIKPEISSITKGPRQTNIELLRILAMFMVMIVHADFVALGEPTWSSIIGNPVEEAGRSLIEIASKGCVNIFILISGWFGIKASRKGFLGFVFQCLYFYVLTYLIMLSLGRMSFHPMMIARFFWFGDSCWFEKSYTALYILSPLLNLFAEKADRRQFAMVLVLFFTFEIVYGLTGSTEYINYGYSAFSFIGLYLLARYIRIYGSKFIHNNAGKIYIYATLINFIAFLVMCRFGKGGLLLSYINPLIILASLGLLMYFNKLKVSYNRFINSVAKSSFSVYLFHTAPAMYVSGFLAYCSFVYAQYSGFYALSVMFLGLVAFFAIAIVFDQPRKLCWNLLCSKIKILNV